MDVCTGIENIIQPIRVLTVYGTVVLARRKNPNTHVRAVENMQRQQTYPKIGDFSSHVQLVRALPSAVRTYKTTTLNARCSSLHESHIVAGEACLGTLETDVAP